MRARALTSRLCATFQSAHRANLPPLANPPPSAAHTNSLHTSTSTLRFRTLTRLPSQAPPIQSPSRIMNSVRSLMSSSGPSGFSPPHSAASNTPLPRSAVPLGPYAPPMHQLLPPVAASIPLVAVGAVAGGSTRGFAKRTKKWQGDPFVRVYVPEGVDQVPSSQPNEGSTGNRNHRRRMLQRDEFRTTERWKKKAEMMVAVSKREEERRVKWKAAAARAKEWRERKQQEQQEAVTGHV